MALASHAGLREAPDAPLSPERVELTVGGFAVFLRGRGLPASVGLAQDSRPRSQELAGVASEAALAAGLGVWELGAVSTPAAKLAARERGLGGAIVVTGSHLGPELTGLKLSAAPLFAPVDVRTLPKPDAVGGHGRLRSAPGAAEEHGRAVAAMVDVASIRAARPAVEITGGSEEEATTLLGLLGCQAGGLRLELDADGDRLDPGDPEWTLPLAAVARRPRLVVRGADTSRMVDGLAAAVRTVPPGELHLVEALAADRTRPALAGEGNGGLVVPELILARDGLAAAALLIELMARSGRSLEEHADELPRLTRRRLELAGDSDISPASRLPGASDRGASAGVMIERGSGLWALVRRSATEPVVRVTVEGPDDASVEALRDEIQASLA
jgi:phosphomannomutase